MIFLSIALLLALTNLSIWRFQYGLIALTLFLPFEYIGVLKIGATSIRLSQLAIMAILIAGGIHIIRTKRLVSAAQIIPLLGLSIVAGLVALRLNYPPIVQGFVTTAALCALVYVLATQLKRQWLPQIYFALLVIASLSAVFGIFQFIGDVMGLSQSITGLRDQYVKEILGYPRVHSVAFEPMYYANFLLIPLFVLIGRWLFKIKLSKWELAAFALILLALLLTMSRGAILAFGLTLIFVGALTARQVLFSKKALATGGGVVIIAACMLLLSSALSGKGLTAGIQRYSSLFTVDLAKTGSYTERSELRDKAVDVWKKSPITGVGVDGVGPYVNNYPRPYTDKYYLALHSHFLELLAQAGILGVLGYYGFLCLIIYQAWKAFKQVDIAMRAWLVGLTAAVIAIHIQAQAFSGFFLSHVWFALGLLLGVILIAKRKSDTIAS